MKMWPLDRLLASPARRPGVALAVGVIGIVASIFAVMRLHPDVSIESLFAGNDPAVAAVTRVLTRFSAAEELQILVSLPEESSGGSSGIEQLMAFARRFESESQRPGKLADTVAQVIYQVDPQTKAFFENVLVPNALFYLDDNAYTAACARLTREQMAAQFQQNESLMAMPGPAAQSLAKVFLRDPLRLHEFILDRLASMRPLKTYENRDEFLSPDGRNLLIRIAGRSPPRDLDFAGRLTSTVNEAIDRINTDHLRVEVSGAYAIADASHRAIRHDAIEGVITSVVGLGALFFLVYRRPLQMFLLALTPVAVGVLYGFAARSLFATTLSPLSAVIGGVLAGMGIDYSIYYLTQYYFLRPRAASAFDAARQTFATIGPALFAAFITSVMGFAAIGRSSVRAMSDFAAVGTLGLAGAFVGCILLLPALLAYFERKQTTLAQIPPDGLADKISSPPAPSRFTLAPLLNLIAGHSPGFASIVILLSISAVAILIRLGPVLPLESDLRVMHPQPNPALDAETTIAARMGTSPGSFILDLRADSPTDLLAAAHQAADRLAGSSVRAAGVRGTFGLASLLPDPHLAAVRLAHLPDAEKVIADFRSVVADSPFDPSAFEPYIAFLRKLLTVSSPPGIESLLPYSRLAETVLPQASLLPGAPPPTETIMPIFLDHPTEDRAARDAALTAVRAAVADVPGAVLTGLAVIGHDAETQVTRELPRLVITAAVAVLLYLVVQFRSPLEPILSLLPAVFSLLCLLAIARATHFALNLINLAAIPLLIGIDVDYGIFLVSLARARRHRGESPAEFLRRIRSPCHSIVVCAAATLLGFGTLSFTSVPAVRSLGVAVSIGIASCLLATFFLLLPILLMLVRRSHKP